LQDFYSWDCLLARKVLQKKPGKLSMMQYLNIADKSGEAADAMQEKLDN